MVDKTSDKEYERKKSKIRQEERRRKKKRQANKGGELCRCGKREDRESTGEVISARRRLHDK